MKIALRSEPLDPWHEVQSHQASLGEPPAERYGATTVFVGTMRDMNEGERVNAMHLEHYAGMTERHLERIVQEAMARWDIQDVLVIHRIGEVRPADPIVVVAVWSAHRAASYDANRFIMEDLKARAPFWKKEILAQGARWVASNTPG